MVLPCISKVRMVKSTPMVGRKLSLNMPSENLSIMDDFPTLEFPMTSILKRQSKFWFRARDMQTNQVMLSGKILYIFNILNLLMANADLALAYATLILVDAKKELSQANLETLVTKAGVKLNAGLSTSMARALKGKDVACWFAVSGGGSAAPQAVKAATAEVKKDDKKDAPPPPPEAEEDVDMGGLFDF